VSHKSIRFSNTFLHELACLFLVPSYTRTSAHARHVSTMMFVVSRVSVSKCSDKNQLYPKNIEEMIKFSFQKSRTTSITVSPMSLTRKSHLMGTVCTAWMSHNTYLHLHDSCHHHTCIDCSGHAHTRPMSHNLGQRVVRGQSRFLNEWPGVSRMNESCRSYARVMPHSHLPHIQVAVRGHPLGPYESCQRYAWECLWAWVKRSRAWESPHHHCCLPPGELRYLEISRNYIR